MSGRRGPTKRKQTDAANGLGSAAMERASMALSIGEKIRRRRGQQKAGMEGKEGKALDGADVQEGSEATNSLKQRVEQDDKAYNKMGTETAASTRKEAGPKETMVPRLDKDKNNGQKVDDKEEDEAVEEEESVGKECGVANNTKVQDSTLEQFLAKVEDALKPIAIFALSKTAFPARQSYSSNYDRMRQAGIYPHGAFGRLVQKQLCARLKKQYGGSPPFDLDDKEIWTDLWMNRIGNYPLGTKIIRSQGHARNKFANRIKYSMISLKRDKQVDMQVVFGGFREIMDEGITAFDALQKVKFFLAGLAYQVVSGNGVAFTNKRFYKPGQVLSRPMEEMKVLNGKSIVECITPSLFSFFLMYVNNCLSVDDNGVFSWNTENTKYTNHGRKDACNGYTQQGIDFYWEMQAQAIVDWNNLKSVNVSKSRADIFHYETQLKLRELKCSKDKPSEVDDAECIKKVDLLLESSEDET